MKIFLDFEFTGLHKYTTPVSLALVAENGQEFYAEFTDYDKDQAGGWIRENILPNTLYVQYPATRRHLIDIPGNHFVGDSDLITMKVRHWLNNYSFIEMWGDCLAYDWVLFCQLFGGAMHLPRNIYYIPFDICTLFKAHNIDPDIDRDMFLEDGSLSRDARCEILGKSVGAHNSLVDARTLKACYEKLMRM